VDRADVTPPALLFVIGASGAGKTAAVSALAARGLRGVRCYKWPLPWLGSSTPSSKTPYH